jgi:hypothetical protein
MQISKTSALKKRIHELEEENSSITQQLLEARAQIDSLQKENTALYKRLGAYIPLGPKAKPIDPELPSPESSLCENCNQEVPTSNYDLHRVQCLRRVTKCPACQTPIQISQLDSHIKSKVGTFEDIVKDIEEGNIASLNERGVHGCKFDIREPNETENSLLHVAIRTGKLEIMQFLLSKGLNINTVNTFGETPLHMACGKYKDMTSIHFLVSKGADMKIKNSMGDSPMDIAKRNAFHEAQLFFQQKMSIGRPGSSAVHIRPSTGGHLIHRNN